MKDAMCRSIVRDEIEYLANRFENKDDFLVILNKVLDGENFDDHDINLICTVLGWNANDTRDYLLLCCN